VLKFLGRTLLHGVLNFRPSVMLRLLTYLQDASATILHSYHIETHSLTPMMLSLDNRYLSCFSMMDKCVSIWRPPSVSHRTPALNGKFKAPYLTLSGLTYSPANNTTSFTTTISTNWCSKQDSNLPNNLFLQTGDITSHRHMPLGFAILLRIRSNCLSSKLAT
jgi:hypothetical protein